MIIGNKPVRSVSIIILLNANCFIFKEKKSKTNTNGKHIASVEVINALRVNITEEGTQTYINLNFEKGTSPHKLIPMTLLHTE